MFVVGFIKTSAATPKLIQNLLASKAANQASKFGAKTFTGAAKMSKPTSVAKATSAIRQSAAGTPGAVQAGFKAQRIERGAAQAAERAKAKPVATAIGGKSVPKATSAKSAPKGAPSEGSSLGQHAETAKNWIRANPLKSAGMGLGAGIALGRMSKGDEQQ